MTAYEHQWEIRRECCCREFAVGEAEVARVRCRSRVWALEERPRALLDRAVVWLIERRVLLPAITARRGPCAGRAPVLAVDAAMPGLHGRAGKLSFATVSQVKIYGTQSRLPGRRDALSDVIHGCVVDALEYPRDKRAHRFFALAPEDFRYPPGRSDDYTIIEISLFEGRSVVAKKKLYALLFERCETQIGIAPVDLEITLTETPRHNWGIRGAPGDELGLDYKIEV